MSLTYASVCSGIEAPGVATRPLGWRPLWFAEISPFPSAVLAHHYPDVQNHGDFTALLTNPPASPDVLIGGTPCQSFSVAGLRGGLTDHRGNLALAFMALVDVLRPRWILWENVPGVLSSNGGRDFGSILGALGKLGYGFAYRILDAQYAGLAQRRKRVFLVGYSGDWRRPAAALFEPESLRRDSPPRHGSGAGVAGAVGTGASSGGGWRVGADEAAANQIVSAVRGWPAEVSPTLTADVAKYQGINNQHLDSQDGGLFVPCVSASLEATNGHRYTPAHETFVAHTLRGNGHDASEDGTGRGVPLVPTTFESRYYADRERMGVRRLSCTEMERLQGFPDGYTAIPYRGKPADQCPDGPRAKALGNSMATNVIRWICERIEIVDAIPSKGTP